jgi:hypothetical protein
LGKAICRLRVRFGIAVNEKGIVLVDTDKRFPDAKWDFGASPHGAQRSGTREDND